MKSKYIGLLILFLLMSFNIGVSGYYYSVLPAGVASEFDAHGDPDVWMPKGTFVIFNVATLILFPVFLLTLSWVCSKLPVETVSLPNRDYWLAPERKAQTYSVFFLFMLWNAVAVDLLLTLIVLLAYRANMGHPEAMRVWPFVLLGGFLIFLAIWGICLYLKFKRVPRA